MTAGTLTHIAVSNSDMAMNLNSGRGAAVINVTPLIDVLLVLLIIFMLIVPQGQFGFYAQIPQQTSSTETHESEAVLVVSVTSVDGTLQFSINQEQVAKEELGTRLAAVFSRRADRTAFLRADRDMEFQQVAGVIDTIKTAGASRIGLMSDPH